MSKRPAFQDWKKVKFGKKEPRVRGEHDFSIRLEATKKDGVQTGETPHPNVQQETRIFVIVGALCGSWLKSTARQSPPLYLYPPWSSRWPWLPTTTTFLTLMCIIILAIRVVEDDDERHRRQPSSSCGEASHAMTSPCTTHFEA